MYMCVYVYVSVRRSGVAAGGAGTVQNTQQQPEVQQISLFLLFYRSTHPHHPHSSNNPCKTRGQNLFWLAFGCVSFAVFN